MGYFWDTDHGKGYQFDAIDTSVRINHNNYFWSSRVQPTMREIFEHKISAFRIEIVFVRVHVAKQQVFLCQKVTLPQVQFEIQTCFFLEIHHRLSKICKNFLNRLAGDLAPAGILFDDILSAMVYILSVLRFDPLISTLALAGMRS